MARRKYHLVNLNSIMYSTTFATAQTCEMERILEISLPWKRVQQVSTNCWKFFTKGRHILEESRLSSTMILLSFISSYKYNVSVNNTTLYFIYNKNSILSGRHISTFIGSSSGPLRKQIQELSTFQCIVGSQMPTDCVTGM